MCGPFLFGSFWWVFPLIAMLMCLGFLFMAFRFAGTRHGCMFMGGHHGERNHHVTEPRV